VGFAAETEDVERHATAKRARKGCDWIVANDVSPETGIMGGTENAVTLITGDGRRELAAHVQGRDRPAAGRAHRGGAGVRRRLWMRSIWER
jgi:phosphopantothenoylcysteine decarboxylase/phosphopantothenate--cysteine ligase